MKDIPYGYCHCGCGQKTSISPQTYTRSHVKKGEPFRFIVGHNAPVDIEEAIWDRVEKHSGNQCWIWKGALTDKGYGTYRGTPAHRIVYELTYGPIPDGLLCCHHCDNPPCVRPDHLFIGTMKDNVRDMWKKKRHKPLEILKGSDNPRAIVNDEQVLSMRKLYREGHPTRELATKFKVGLHVVWCAVTYRTWKHLP